MTDGDPGPVASVQRADPPAEPTAGGHDALDHADSAPPDTGPKPFRLGNRQPLTGIRVLALFTVLTHHANFKTMPGAWAAIQVFVLSGFLITGEGMRNGRVSLKGFYARRAARLLPPSALTAVLPAVYAAFGHVAEFFIEKPLMGWRQRSAAR